MCWWKTCGREPWTAWGLPPQELWKINKGLVIGRISGYGQTGPYAAKPGFGTLAESMSGYSYLNTHPGQPPTSPPSAAGGYVDGIAFGLGDHGRSAHAKARG